MKITNMSVSSNDEFEGKPGSFGAHVRIECATAEEAFAFIDAARALLIPKVDPVEAAVVRAAPAARAPKPAKAAEPEEEPEEESKPKAKAAKAKPEPEPEEDDDEVEVIPAGKPTVKITKELKNAQKLRDVLKILIDSGINSKKALVKECKALQSHVPVLERIEDLDGRVPKAAEIVSPDIED